MAGEFTEELRTYTNLAKANGLELSKELDNTLIDIIKIKEQKDKKKYRFMEKSEENKEVIDEFGSFYFNFYNKYNQVERQYLFRFMYLCAFMNYENILANNRRSFNEDDLKKILNLSNSEYYRTKNSLLDNEFIRIQGKEIIINDVICKKGKVKINKSIEVVRMFDNAIKELYINSVPREHKKLALLIEILPYVNYKYNVLCHNPKEENLTKIKPLSMRELCCLVRYDENNSNKLKKDLFKIRVGGELVIGIWERACGKTIHVNPCVYYKGKVKFLKEKVEDGLSILDAFKMSGS